MRAVLCRRVVFNCRDREGVNGENQVLERCNEVKRGSRVNIDKTKVMSCTVRTGRAENSKGGLVQYVRQELEQT